MILKNINSILQVPHKKFKIYFYAIWIVIGLIQAWGTELFDDEAYYWVYSKFLDWGYFDHPPMIAILIKFGYFIFPSELGVRLFIVVLGTATIYFIEQLVKPKNPKLFYALVLNIALLQIGSIMAVPDIPLLFFTVLFFLAYKSFSEKQDLKGSLLLSIVIALLLYSKYHGILIILFTLFSNLKLLKKPITYGVIIFSILLFMPHVWWQIAHGYPSINYHLFERVSPEYNFSFTTDFVLGQLLIVGPLAGWLVIWAAMKYKPSTDTEKAMYWCVIGFYILFFLSSFKSRTEANWTIPLIAPLIVLSYQFFNTDHRSAKWIYRLLPYSLAIVLIVRIYMMLDIAPFKFLQKDEFHQNKTWAASIKKQAGSMPVVFTNSYQRASKYWFYTGDTSFSLNTYKYRRNNYNFWPLEERIQGKTVLLVGSEGAEFMTDTIQTPKSTMAYKVIDPFFSLSQIVLNQGYAKLYRGEKLHAFINITHKKNDETFNKIMTLRPYLMLMIYQSPKDPVLVINTGEVFAELNENVLFANIDLQLPKLKGKKFTIRWGLQNRFDEPSINSSAYAFGD